MATVKKGFIAEVKTDLLTANYDYCWRVVMDGKTSIGASVDAYKELPIYKRGLVHRPSLVATIDENGSFFLELLQQVQVSAVNQGAPIIIDMFNTPSKYTLKNNLENVRLYVSYICDHWMKEQGLTVKPLLRLNMATWNSYLSTNYAIAVGLLDTIDILAVQWGVEKPDEWKIIGTPKWWEYENGMVAYDADATWVDSPVASEEEDDSEDDPAEDPVDNGSTLTSVVSGGLFPLNSKTSIKWESVDGKVVPTEITVKAIEESV